MEITDILSKVDHTNLKQIATWDDIKKLCEEGVKYNVASVCIPPSFVKRAKDTYGDRLKICTVIGFPNGYNTTAVKVFEAKDAIANGADEIDMVINVGKAKEHDYDYIEKEIALVVASSAGKCVKVILETCYLTDEEKVACCKAAQKAGATFVKTSTGFGTGGATVEDVKLMRETVGDTMGVKASGGIRSLQDLETMVEAGASRIGASSGVAIMQNLEANSDY